MLLAINVNNTNVKFGVIDGDRIVGEWRQHTSAMRTADEHAVWLFQLMKMEGIDPKSITDAIIGSVVPQANFNIRRLCTRYFNCEPLFLGEPNVVYGIKIKGEGAGADRICNTVGAHVLFPKTAMIVVDFGTATTFDAISKKGEYLGGVIAPGIQISSEALYEHAAKLPRVELARPGKVVARNTIASMQAGLVYGYAGMVDALVERIRAEVDWPARCIATGGLAPLIATETKTIEATDELLTLKGLKILYQRNQA